MAETILMPKLSDFMTEGTITTWYKKVGDSVKNGDLLAEIETDKAKFELESYQEGILLHIGTSIGGKLKVYELLAILGSDGEDITNIIVQINKDFEKYTTETSQLLSIPDNTNKNKTDKSLNSKKDILNYKITKYQFTKDYFTFSMSTALFLIWYFIGTDNTIVISSIIIFIISTSIILKLLNRHFYNGLIMIAKDILRINDLDKYTIEIIAQDANRIIEYRLSGYKFYWNDKSNLIGIDEPYILSLKEIFVHSIIKYAKEYQIPMKYFNYIELFILNRIYKRVNNYNNIKESKYKLRVKIAEQESVRRNVDLDDIIEKQYENHEKAIELKKIELKEQKNKSQKKGIQQLFGKCPYCYKPINAFASKCPYCTADL